MSEQTNDNEKAQETQQPKQKSEADKTREVMDLLAGKKPDEDNDNAGDEGDEGDEQPRKRQRDKPKTLADAAKRLGLTDEEFYALQLGDANGDAEEKHTLGSIKDHHTKREQHALDVLAWGEERATQEGELLRSRNELTELMASLPAKALTPEILEKIRERHSATVSREKALTLTVIPEWRNESVRDTEQAAMREHLDRAGFPKGYLDKLVDHRTMRYVRENYLREQRINAALALVKEKPKQKQTEPTRRGKASESVKAPSSARNDARGNANQANQVRQITNLITGKGT